MANKEHLKILEKGKEAWNTWREGNRHVVPDLRRADLRRAHLSGFDFTEADLRTQEDLNKQYRRNASMPLPRQSWPDDKFAPADLSEAKMQGSYLTRANLARANLTGADLSGACLEEAHLARAVLRNANLDHANLNRATLTNCDLSGASLRKAKLTNLDNIVAEQRNWADPAGANLRWANLQNASLAGAILRGACLQDVNLTNADLCGADLEGVTLSRSDLSGANLAYVNLKQAILVEINVDSAVFSSCGIYGISVWGLRGTPAKQIDLRVSRWDEPDITVDSLEVAQFIYMLLHSDKLRTAIATIARKVVLILGRFTPKRKLVLDAVREALREHDYVPVLFDFPKPDNKTYLETVSTLAHLARFVIADFTDGKIVYDEVPHIWKNVLIPIVPLMLKGSEDRIPVTLFDLRIANQCVLDTFYYENEIHLLASLKEKVIDPAESRAHALEAVKGRNVPH
jgi:uncharacterized protein YjbI with pentapeptide repeats